MRSAAFVVCILGLALQTQPTVGQEQYQPNWQSIDGRPTSQWFKDAKFGVFICWGFALERRR